MFIIRNIPEQKYFADIKHPTDSSDLRDSVTELAWMLKSFMPHMSITIEEENILVLYQWIYLSQSVVICMWSM